MRAMVSASSGPARRILVPVWHGFFGGIGLGGMGRNIEGAETAGKIL